MYNVIYNAKAYFAQVCLFKVLRKCLYSAICNDIHSMMNRQYIVPHIFLRTCSFLQPSHDEQIFSLLSTSYHMLSDNTYPTGYFALSPK